MNEKEQKAKRGNKRSSNSKNSSQNSKNSKTNTDTQKVSSANSGVHYMAHPELLIDAGSLAFSQMLGVGFTIGSPINRAQTISNAQIAGIMRLGITPTFGGSHDPNSSINVASRAIYSWVRHANSGRSNYEAPDLFIYIMAVTHLHALLSKLQRAYGTANLFTLRNRLYPKALIESQNIQYDDLIENLASYRMQINNLALKIGTLAVPATMPIVPHLVNRLRHVYLDAASEKAQSYVFDLDVIGEFDATSLETGGLLKYRSLKPTTLQPLQWFIDIANDLVNAILRNEDMNIMSGDILKAYGDNILRTEAIEPEYVVLPVYDEHILLEIENSTVLDTTLMSSIQDDENILRQEQGYLVNPLFFSTDNPAVLFDKFTNVHWDNPTPLDVMLSTRSSLIMDQASITYFQATQTLRTYCSPRSTPTELLTSATIYFKDEKFKYRSHLITEVGAAKNLNPIGLLVMQSAFRRAPLVGAYDMRYVSSEWRVTPLETPIMGQIDNYTLISYDVYQRLNEVATMSLFNVTRIGT